MISARPLERHPSWRVALAFGLLGFLLYLPVVGFGFVSYDDPWIYLGQTELFGRGFVEGVRAVFSNLPREEPLLVRDLSWVLDAALFGFGSGLGPHLGNLIIHAANCGLVFLVLERVRFSQPVAVIAAAIFAVHPVHVEPVAWVMGRKDVLSTFFALASILAWSTFRARTGRVQLGWGIAVVGLFGLGCLSKVSVVTVPAIWMAIAVVESQSSPRRPLRLADAAAIAAASAVGLAILVWYYDVLTAFGILGARGPSALSMVHLTQLAQLLPAQAATYVGHFVVPWDYGVFYDRPAVGITPSIDRLIVGRLVIAAVAAGLIVSFRRAPLVFLCLVGVSASLLPYLNLVYIGIFAGNRYLYLPSVFAAGLTALGLVAAWRKRPLGPAAVVGLAVGWGAVATYQHIRHLYAWRDNASLWAYELSRSAPSILAFSGATRVLVRRAEKKPRAPEREAWLKRASALIDAGMRRFAELRVEPVPGYVNYQRLYLGKLHHWRGRLIEVRDGPTLAAIHAYEAALDVTPDSRLYILLLARAHTKRALAARGADDPRALSFADAAFSALARAKPTNDDTVRRMIRALADGLPGASGPRHRPRSPTPRPSPRPRGSTG